MMSDEQRERCAGLARAIVRGDVDLIEGGHDLVVSLRDAGMERDPDAVTLQGFCAGTDVFPRHWLRHLWAADALAENDGKRERYIEEWRERVVAACRALEDKLSGQRDRA